MEYYENFEYRNCELCGDSYPDEFHYLSEYCSYCYGLIPDYVPRKQRGLYLQTLKKNKFKDGRKET